MVATVMAATGFLFILADKFIQRGANGEIDLARYDGEALAFVAARTRTVGDGHAALPALSATKEKQEVMALTAQRFLMERHRKDCPVRFEVVAIDKTEGEAPVVRLHKAACSPRM